MAPRTAPARPACASEPAAARQGRGVVADTAAVQASEHSPVTPTSSDVVSEAVEEVAADRQPPRGRQDPGRHGRRPHRRSRSQGHALPPRPDARPRGRHPRGQGPRGAPRDARRDPPATGRLARLRCLVPGRADEALSARPARDRLATRGGARPRCPARGGRRVPGRPAGLGAASPRAAADGLAPASRRCPRPPDPRARLGRLPALGRRLPRFRADRGRRA